MKHSTHHPTILAIFLLASLILTACGGIFYTPPADTEHCDIDPALLEPETAAEAAAEAAGKTVIELWATAERQYCWRAYAPLVTAHQRPDLSISVRVSNLEINERPLGERLMELAVRGEAPDVAYLFQQEPVRLGEAGHLYPLESCRHKPAFQAIPTEFWTSFSADGQAWGVPVDMDLMLLFYNKEILSQLGWTQAQIDGFPAQIARGDFLQDDLIATARQAVASGVVEQGLAFIPNRVQSATVESFYTHNGGHFVNPNRDKLLIQRSALEQTYSFLAALHKHQLLDRTLAVPAFGDWGNKLILRDAAAHNRLLFWQATSSEFPRLALDYIGKSGDTVTLNEQIGVALLPARTSAQSAYARLLNAGQFVIFAHSATGRSNQEAACELLAATQNHGIYPQHTQKSGHISFANDGFYLPDWFSSHLSLDALIWTRPHFPRIKEYSDILVETGARVERGDLSASEATDVAIQHLRDTFGSQLIVE